MIRDCVYLLGVTVLLGTGIVWLLSVPVAAEGGIDAGHIEVDAPELDGSGYYSSVEVTFGEDADFGGEEKTTALRFELKETEDALIREIKPEEEIDQILMNDGGYLLFEENRSGESIGIQIHLELESDLRYDLLDSFPLVTTVADEEKDYTIEDSFDGFIDGFVHDETVDGETAVNLTVNPGPPTDIDIDLPSSTGDHTPEPVNLEFEDEYGNEFQSHPATITLTSERYQVSEDLDPATDTWPPTIGINGTVDPIIGNTTVKATANDHTASTELWIYPENPEFQSSYEDLDADGDCELPVELHLTKPRIGVEPLDVELKRGAGPDSIWIHKQGEDVESPLGDDSTVRVDVTDPVSTYLVTAETPGEYTLTAAPMPGVEGIPTATGSVTAHGQIQAGNITVSDQMVGTAIGNNLRLTIDELATDQGTVGYTQRSITGMVFDDRTVPVEPVTPAEGTFSGVVELKAADLTPGDIEQIGIEFEGGTGGSISTATSIEVVHERTSLSGSGWHRLSVPVTPAAVKYDGIQTDRNGDPVEIGWSPTDQQYEHVDQWDPADRVHRGWYVYTESEATVGVTYSNDYSTEQNRSLRSGWNLLGTHFDVSENASTSIDAELSNIANATVGDQPDGSALTGWDTYWVYADHQQHRSIAPLEYDPADRATNPQSTASTVEMETTDGEYPGDPARYTGTVAIDDTPISEGSTVTVGTANGDQTITVGPEGQFSLVVEQDSELTFTTDETDSCTRTATDDTGTFKIDLESTSSSPRPAPAPSPAPPTDPEPPEPTAVPDVPSTATVGTNVTLRGEESDGAIESYSWIVDDTHLEGQTVTTVFDTTGTHDVTLVVTDTHDRSDQATTSIEITEAAGVQVDEEQQPDQSTLLTGIQLYALIGATLLVIAAGLVYMTRSRIQEITGI